MRKCFWMQWGAAIAVVLVITTGSACTSTVEDEPEPAEPAGEATAGGGETPTARMTNGLGEERTLTLRELSDSRGYIYCELGFTYLDHGTDLYSTSPLAPCDIEWWDNLDLDALAEEFGAEVVFKNGPQWWSMDEVSLMLSPPVAVAGAEMMFGGVLPPGTTSIPHYTVFNPAKYQNLTWKAGQPMYQIVDAEGNAYVVQGHKIPVGELPTLGERMEGLPEGWEYQVAVLEEDLVMNLTPAEPIPSIQDEFDQIYIRIPG